MTTDDDDDKRAKRLAHLQSERRRVLAEVAALEAYALAAQQLDSPNAADRCRMHALGITAPARQLAERELPRTATAGGYVPCG